MLESVGIKVANLGVGVEKISANELQLERVHRSSQNQTVLHASKLNKLRFPNEIVFVVENRVWNGRKNVNNRQFEYCYPLAITSISEGM